MSGRRARLLAGAVALALVGLVGCDPAFQSDTPTTKIGLFLDAPSGGDVLTIYGPDAPSLASSIVDEVPMRLPRITYAAKDPVFGDEAEIAEMGSRRLAVREGDRWVLRLDLGRLQRAVAAAGLNNFLFSICHPGVETRLSASRDPDDPEWCYPTGWAWDIDAEDPALTLTMTMMPDEGDWRLFVYALGGWFAFYSLIAFAIGRIMRREFRVAGAGIVVAGGAFALLGAVMMQAPVAAGGFGAGAADNLALARDYGQGGYVLAALGPGAGALIPVLVFVLTLAWGRPWRRSRALRRAASAEVVPPPVPPA